MGMKSLIDKYQLKDPVEKNGDQRGIFDNLQLKKLFDDLTTSGKTSLEGAFRAGAKVEEVDIRDLKEAMANTSNKEIKSTYADLISASENHLRAFVRNLKRLEINYTPVVMDKKEFELIINSDKGKGMGMGKGKGQCCEKNSLR
jgi:rubrerythrin